MYSINAVLAQLGTVCVAAIYTFRRRWATSLVTVIGTAGVVGVLVSILAMAVGLTNVVGKTGRDDRAIVLRAGASGEATSLLTREEVNGILDAEGIRLDAAGHPIASAEFLISVPLMEQGNDASEVAVALRGVGSTTALRPELKLLEGRMFRSGKHELIAGRTAASQFANLSVGSQIKARGTLWTVTGIFSSDGDGHESELLTDNTTLLAIMRRTDYQSVIVALQSPAAFATLQQSLAANPTLSVDVIREAEFFAKQSEAIARLIYIAAYVLGGIMALGAIFAALNTTYAAVSTRASEIAILRAIGFGGEYVALSVVIEAAMLALLGSALGVLIAWGLVNGRDLNTSFGGGGQLVFDVTVTPPLMLTGVLIAVIISVIGSVFPAARTASVPIVVAIREA